MTLNTVSALGLLTVGIFGFPFLGAVKDSYDAKSIRAEKPALYAKYGGEKKFFGVTYPSIRAAEVFEDSSLAKLEKEALQEKVEHESARKTLRVAASLPFSMAICFGIIVLWFRFQGGYKPVVLDRNTDSSS